VAAVPQERDEERTGRHSVVRMTIRFCWCLKDSARKKGGQNRSANKEPLGGSFERRGAVKINPVQTRDNSGTTWRRLRSLDCPENQKPYLQFRPANPATAAAESTRGSKPGDPASV